jgi:DNA (cytosine-5)-methyltransferase 1
VDIIAGGFPCQDISYAGKGAGLDGERSGLFYEVARIVSEMGPRFVVLENVSALLTRGMGDVLGTLASLGYDAEWHCITASSVGAPHRRDRVFIIAHAQSERCGARRSRRTTSVGSRQEDASEVADPEIVRRDIGGVAPNTIEGPSETFGFARGACEGSADVSNAERGGREAWSGCEGPTGQRRAKPSCGGQGGAEYASQWATEPNVGRVADGVPARVDRLRGLGNAVVPQVAEWIARRIVESSNSVTRS